MPWGLLGVATVLPAVRPGLARPAADTLLLWSHLRGILLGREVFYMRQNQCGDIIPFESFIPVLEVLQ